MTKPLESRLARRMRDRGDLVIGTPLRRLERAGVKIRPRVVSITADEVGFQDESAVRAAAVVWATGFRGDYAWVDIPGAFDAEGRPHHERGISPARGLAFVGLPWQHTSRSALLGFVRHDAAWVAAPLDAQHHQTIEDLLRVQAAAGSDAIGRCVRGVEDHPSGGLLPIRPRRTMKADAQGWGRQWRTCGTACSARWRSASTVRP